MKAFRPALVATTVAAALSASMVNASTNALLAPANYDRASASNKIFSTDTSLQRTLAEQKTKSGMLNQYDAKMSKTTFAWAGETQAKPDLTLIRPEHKVAYAANFYLHALTGFSADENATNKAALAYLHDTSRGGLIAKYRQQIQGIEVFNKEYNVIMDREYNLVAGSGYFGNKAPAENIIAMLANFGSAESAIETAIADLTRGKARVSLSKASENAGYELYRVENSGTEQVIAGQPRAKKVFYELNGTLQAAYYVEISATEPESLDSISHSYIIQANNNKVLFRNNLVAHAGEFTYRVYANQDGYPWDGPHGDVIPAAAPGNDPSEILEAPLVTLRNYSKISTDDPWLAEDATITSGNNAFAYADVIAPQGFSDGDYAAEITGPNTFDYSLDSSQRASSLQNGKAGVLNLFLLGNFLHDWWYDHGFDEASGNAQVDNYGRGGLGGDPLELQGQDYSGLNNANMFTPADGASPRMQQFLYNSKDAANGTAYGLSITSHPALGLLTSTQLSSFGPSEYSNVIGEIVRVNDSDAVNSGAVTDGCEALTNPEEITGKIAIIDRGSCTFTSKVLNAQDAGAIGVIVVNNIDDGTPAPMGGNDFLVTIPNVGLNYAEGHAIYDLITAGETVNGDMFSTFPLKDSSFDNGIIAHEWGHFIQNRLVGNANGLVNFQGRALGEGWSDFHSMMLLVLESDRNIENNAEYQVPYATGTYVEDFFYGIRRVPYSTDMTANPLSFRHIEEGAGADVGLPGTSVASPHAPGEIWATMLWDVYVALLNTHEFDVAQSRMADYLVAGYKMTPLSPTYTEARDAILAAMYANDPADYELAMAAFARRGLGFGAVAPDRNDGTLSGVVESTATQLATFSAKSVEVDANYDGIELGYCSDDNILDVGETGTVMVTIQNTGSDVLSGVTAQLQVTSGQDVTFANDGLINFDDLDLFAETISVPVMMTLNEATAADTLVIEVVFPEQIVDDEIIEPAPVTFSTRVNMDFSPVAIANSAATSDMETLAALNDFAINIISGGERAATTQSLDTVNTALFESLNPGIQLGNQTMYLANNNFPADVAVETTAIEVGYGSDFSVSFWHFYWLEVNFDGGVVEISINDGEWVDVTDVGGSFSQGYTGELASELPGRATFTGINGDLVSTAGNIETISFGDALNGQTVRLRFRIVSDFAVADYGWNIDNVTFTNITNPIYSEVIAGDSGECDNSAPKIIEVTEALTLDEGTTQTLAVTAADRNGDTLSYQWSQIEGPAATLNNAETSTLSFTPMDVSAATDLVFQVSVSDGTDAVTASVTVTVNDVPAVPQEPISVDINQGGGSAPWYTIALLPLAWLRRRAGK